jgi:hypothetical protein
MGETMFLSRLIIILLASTVLSQTVIYKYTKEQQATYASFAAYLTAAGTTLTSFEVGKDIPIISTTRIQNTLDVRAFTSGAKFTGTSTLYIGKMSAKPEGQIFDTALTVYFDSGSVSEVYTHWWGNSKAAFRRANNAAALNGIPLVISKYSYPIAGKITTSASLDISRVLNSGKVKGNTGSAVDTLVIGRMTSVPTHQWIDTSITVQFASGAVSAVRPEWWYDGLSWTKAIQKACNTGLTVKMSNRTYDSTKLTESISLFTDKQTILCDGTFLMGYRDFPLFVVGQTENGALPSSIVQFVTISGLNITGNKTTGSGAIYTRKTTRSSLNDFYIDGLDFGIAGDGKIGSHESLLMNFNRLQIYGCNVGVNDTAGSYQASTFYNCIIERNKYEGVITKSRNLNFIGGAIEGNNANNIYAYGDEKHAEVRLLANKGTCNFTDVYMESVSKDSIDCVIELADGEADAFPTLIIKGGIYSFNSSGSTNWYFLKNSGLRQWQIKINGAVLQATFKGVLNDLSGLCVLQINGAGMPGTVKIDSGLNLYQKYMVLGQFGPYGFDNRNQKARWRNNDSDPVSFSLSAKQGNSGFPVFKQEMQWDTNTIAKIEALTGNDTTNKTNGYMSFYTRDTLDTVPVERFRIKKNPYIPSNTRYFQHGQYAYYGIDAGASPYSGAYMYHDGTDWVSSHPTLRGSVLRNAGGYFYLQSADANTNPATGVRDHFLIDIINKSFVVYDTLTAANIKGVTKFINKTEATSTSTGSGQFDGGVSVDSSIWCGKNLSVADSAHAVNVVKTFRLRTDSVIVGANRVVSSRGAALTPQLTSITHTEPGTPDYAIQDFTQTAPWGYASQNEANSVLKVILNLQTRVAELEARLKATGGHGLIAD